MTLMTYLLYDMLQSTFGSILFHYTVACCIFVIPFHHDLQGCTVLEKKMKLQYMKKQ